MIAVGRRGQDVVFIGERARLSCTEEEARGVLRQLAALLQEAPAPMPASSAAARTLPLFPALGPAVAVDPAAEARAADQAQAAARPPPTPAPSWAPPPRQKDPEEVAKQENRRRLQRERGEAALEEMGETDE